jgi:hypothetical protein
LAAKRDRHNKPIIARLDRAIQYAAASQHYHWRLWILGRPFMRAMTVVPVSSVRAGPNTDIETAMTLWI